MPLQIMSLNNILSKGTCAPGVYSTSCVLVSKDIKVHYHTEQAKLRVLKSRDQWVLSHKYRSCYIQMARMRVTIVALEAGHMWHAKILC